MVWFVLWMVCASESPSQHGRINSAERQYIIDTLMTEAVTSQQVSIDLLFLARQRVFMPPPTIVGGEHYVFGLSVRPLSVVRYRTRGISVSEWALLKGFRGQR